MGLARQLRTEERQRVLTRVAELACAGMEYSAICDTLNKEGYLNAYGNPFQVSGIRCLIFRARDAGYNIPETATRIRTNVYQKVKFILAQPDLLMEERINLLRCLFGMEVK